MQIFLRIALKHLMARKRQSVVSLMGIVLGVGFFLAISSLMKGSETDFIHRLVDNTPHITIYDEYRVPRSQPLAEAHPEAVVGLPRVKPLTEVRGIRGYPQVIEYLRTLQGVTASPVLAGQALLNFAGKDYAVTLNGMIPEDIQTVSTIENYMVEGSIADLIANPDGIIIGADIAEKLSLSRGENITVASTTGQVRTFKILGIFRTGRANYDNSQTFASIKRVQALLDRPNRANNIIIKLADPYSARVMATSIERQVGYKSVSWQETSEDMLSVLTVRNIIMYTVVSAVLVVASFGIYNVISTVVLEKQRDIAILKSMGFKAHDIQHIFVIQGFLLGIAGSVAGIPLGCLLMTALGRVQLKPPGETKFIHMPLDWSWPQFAIAFAFAMTASVMAAFLPARKAARVQPVEILRGGS